MNNSKKMSRAMLVFCIKNVKCFVFLWFFVIYLLFLFRVISELSILLRLKNHLMIGKIIMYARFLKEEK